MVVYFPRGFVIWVGLGKDSLSLLPCGISGVARLVVGPPAGLLSHRLPGDAGWEPRDAAKAKNTSTQPFPVAALAASHKRELGSKGKHEKKANFLPFCGLEKLYRITAMLYKYLGRHSHLEANHFQEKGIRLYLRLGRVSGL